MGKTKEDARKRRKSRIRAKVVGTAERPRLTVFRSLKHIYAQVVDDTARTVVTSASTNGKANADTFASLSKIDCAKKVGEMVAESLKAKGVTQVVFDRNGYRYHGRVSALAAAAREAGLQF